MTSKRNKSTKTSKPAKSASKAQKADPIKSELEATAERGFVPLNKLIPDPKNVRRYQSDAGLDELCAMIVSEGLIQNLAVRPAPRGKFYVTAGVLSQTFGYPLSGNDPPMILGGVQCSKAAISINPSSCFACVGISPTD